MVLIKKKKKLSAEEVEAQKKEKELRKSGIQDEFQAKGFELVTWAQKHKPRIIVGILVLASALVLWAGVAYYSGGAKIAASAEYESALEVLGKVATAQGEEQEKLRQDALKAFEDLSTKHANSPMAKVASFYAGDLALALKDPKKAISSYEIVLKLTPQKDPLRQVALLGLATSYESDSQPKKALEIYESMLDSGVKIDEPMVLWQAQRLAKQTGQNEKASGFASRLIANHGSSSYANETYFLPSKLE